MTYLPGTSAMFKQHSSATQHPRPTQTRRMYVRVKEMRRSLFAGALPTTMREKELSRYTDKMRQSQLKYKSGTKSSSPVLQKYIHAVCSALIKYVKVVCSTVWLLNFLERKLCIISEVVCLPGALDWALGKRRRSVRSAQCPAGAAQSLRGARWHAATN